jgi:repressor LexA
MMEMTYLSSEHTSDIQKRIYEFLVEYIREEGIPPTNREIGSAMNIASTGHVDYHLSMLEKKGYITRESKKSRSITLVQQPFGIRVMGSIAVGEPLEIFTDPTEAIDVGKDFVQQGAYALVVKGQSMIQDNIGDKDYVIMKPQNTCENGDIVVAVHLQGDGRATLRRFFEEKDRDRVRLQPANSGMDPTYIPKSEWDREWQIQGKVLAVFRKLDSRSDDISSRRMRVFLCHSSGDKLSVRQLYRRLKACNLDPWLDEENLLPGQDWENEIRKAVREADVVIVCLSHGSISKTGFVQKEIKFALDVAEEKPEDTIFLIPLKLEECVIPQRLRRWQWVKYFEQDGFDKLMKTLTLNISV